MRRAYVPVLLPEGKPPWFNTWTFWLIVGFVLLLGAVTGVCHVSGTDQPLSNDALNYPLPS